MRAPAWITVREDARQDESRDDGPFRGVVAVERASRLEIVRRWMLPSGRSYAWAVWCAVTLVMTSIAAAHHAVVWCGLLGSAAAVSCYSTLGLFVNRTRVTLDDGTLRVRHGPLRWLWMPDRDLPIDRIARVFARPLQLSSNDEHEVVVELKRRGETQLLRGIANAEQATFLAQAIDTSVRAHDLRAAAASLP